MAAAAPTTPDKGAAEDEDELEKYNCNICMELLIDPVVGKAQLLGINCSSCADLATTVARQLAPRG